MTAAENPPQTLRPYEAGWISDTPRGFLAQPQLLAAASAQHLVLSLEQLQAIGLSRRAVYYRAKRGMLHRVHRGVYSLVPPEHLPREGRWLAAVLACGPGAVLSHASAAALHEIRGSSGELIHVTVPGRTARIHPGTRVHRSTTLSSTYTTVRDGIPTTTVTRTLLDLAGAVSPRALERALDQAEVMGALNLGALREQIDSNHTTAAATRLAAVLRSHYAGSTITWSELEERLLDAVRTAGLPLPECNVPILIGPGHEHLRPDFLWRRQRVLLQVDGFRSHRTRQSFERDRRQDLLASASGWSPLRATWQQVERAAHEVVGAVGSLLALADQG